MRINHKRIESMLPVHGPELFKLESPFFVSWIFQKQDKRNCYNRVTIRICIGDDNHPNISIYEEISFGFDYNNETTKEDVVKNIKNRLNNALFGVYYDMNFSKFKNVSERLKDRLEKLKDRLEKL